MWALTLVPICALFSSFFFENIYKLFLQTFLSVYNLDKHQTVYNTRGENECIFAQICLFICVCDSLIIGNFWNPLFRSRSRSRSYGQSVSMSWCRATLWDLQPDITSCPSVVRNLWSYFSEAPSLTRERVYNLQCNHSLVRVTQNP
jgi:hypothetical protein